MLTEIRLHERTKACKLELWQGRPRLFRHCGNQPMHTSLHPVVFSGDTMTDVDRAYNIVRKELAEVGLLAEGKYLDQIELWISDRPSEGESAYIFEAPGPWISKGYKPGVIYLPSEARTAASWLALPSFSLRLAMNFAYSSMKILPGGRKSKSLGLSRKNSR